jgi:hypothetical protein
MTDIHIDHTDHSNDLEYDSNAEQSGQYESDDNLDNDDPHWDNETGNWSGSYID